MALLAKAKVPVQHTTEPEDTNQEGPEPTINE